MRILNVIARKTNQKIITIITIMYYFRKSTSAVEVPLTAEAEDS